MIRTHALFSATLLVASLAMALPATAQQAELAAENYRQADVNDDGLLDYAEFTTFIDLSAADGIGNTPKVSSRGMHARAFARIDSNDDGVVSPDELQAVE